MLSKGAPRTQNALHNISNFGQLAQTLSRARYLRRLYFVGILLFFLCLASYNLGLPGLHYDEAKEAGLNAMEMLTGAPVNAFRHASITLFGIQAPLMVQDYIGALNVYLALPFLWLSGIGVPNLRMLAILTAVAALFTLERALSEWQLFHTEYAQSHSAQTPSPQSHTSQSHTTPVRTTVLASTPISLAGLLAVTLLAFSPSFIFWSRQGIFVTNLTQPLTLACIWQGVRWLRLGHNRALLWSALLGGFALYAKVQAIWLIGPFGLLAAGWWWYQWRRGQKREIKSCAPNSAHRPLTPALMASTVSAFLLPLLPLILFNWQTGGLLNTMMNNAQTSYYGVDNADLLGNLAVRWTQFGQMLRGDHFWYLGGIYANGAAPWLWGLLFAAGIWCNARILWGPLLLLLGAFSLSLFTISDLFITHFALLQPLTYGVAGLAAAQLLTLLLQPGADNPMPPLPETSSWVQNAAERPAHFAQNAIAQRDFTQWHFARRHLLSGAVCLLLLTWATLDLTSTVRYYGALQRSGGLADHSDASYHLAHYLQYNGLGAPIALDWGMDAPVRFLSQGTVTPIEIFGYASTAQPDGDFAQRLAQFLVNPDNVYLLHTAAQTVFQGRSQVFQLLAEQEGRTPILVQTVAQRDGTPLFEIWRVP